MRRHNGEKAPKRSHTGTSVLSEARTQAQLTGDVALYAVCLELARRGWRVAPTSSNARHVDIVGYLHEDPGRVIAVQVKGASAAAFRRASFWTCRQLPSSRALFVVFVVLGDPPEFYVVPSGVVAQIKTPKYGDVHRAKIWRFLNRWPLR